MSDALETLVFQLTKRVEKLEYENKIFKKWISREKKKVSIQQWLTDNWKPSTAYTTWQKDIKPSQKDLENVFKHGFSTGSYYIIQRHLPLEQHQSFPIIGFKQRGRVFYIYHENKWQVMEKAKMVELIDDINTKLFDSFRVWEKANPEITFSSADEATRILWQTKLNKILLLPEKKDAIIKKIRNRLFQYLQMDLKNITEYEFSF
jgi:hypothetical protein